ncbi:opsin 8, group member b [Esox lucius]|uniref:G-protein coupled receptors family 1 profile domain-containing protein n=1 Tax=Esox lucius TaxID=8010 RepID=A0AAY5KJ30_ESOLU|nr:opsin 8, group member b [Esox lucius]
MDIYSSKLSPAVDFVAGALLLVIAVLSIVGNLLVLIMAFKRSSQMKPPELLSVNLAVTDLGAAVFMYPLSVASAWSHRWLGGDSTCKYYGLVGFFFGVASMMTLTMMAVVRFIVSLSLHSPKEKISRRSVKLLCLWTWLCALLWASFPLLGWGRYGPEPFGISCTLAWGEMKEEGFYFVISLFTFNFLGPSIVILFCYFGLVVKLYISYRSLDNNQQVSNIIKMHRRLLTIAVLISLGFIVAWSPYAMVSLWSVFRSSELIPPEVSMLPCLFAKSSTVYNPLIYYIFSNTFKREVKQLCGRANACHASNPANNISENVIYLVCDGSRLDKTEKVSDKEVERAQEDKSSF